MAARPTHRGAGTARPARAAAAHALTLALALAFAAPSAARATSLTIEDPGDDALVSQEECLSDGSLELDLTWDLGTTSGESIEILGSDGSSCDEDDDTTAILVDGIDPTQTTYPESGDLAITAGDVLSAAGRSTTCDGSDFRVYVCVRLMSSSGSQVAIASAPLKYQLTRPPAPISVAVAPGEKALHVSWTEGDATSDAPASSETYRVFAAANGVTVHSSETDGTSVRLDGLTNGTTYDVWVVAYSAGGNPSDESVHASGTPVPVMDFWEAYETAGGVDSGGCSQGGDAGPFALVAAGLALLRAVRRREDA